MIEGWIDRAVARAPEASFLEDARSGRRVPYGTLAEWRHWWNRRLDALGVASGAPVALRLTDHVAYATAFVSLLGAGRAVVPLDPRSPTSEVERVAALIHPAATVTDPVPGPDGADLSAVIVHRSAPSSPAWDSSGAGVYLCTSGTTGAPKTIWLPVDQLAYVAAGIANHHRLGPTDRGLCPLPLFHVNAEVVGLLGTLAAGACLVVDDRFHRTGFWELVSERSITWVNAVPAIIAVLASTPQPDRPPNSVRFVRSASAPLPAAVLRSFEEQAGLPVLETYGMTEAASMITANPLEGPRKPGAVGLPVRTEMKVVDRSGRCLPTGEVGRVAIRGRGVISAYASGGRPGAFSPDGWLDTGDLGYRDGDGFLYLVGRADDVINRGGENIYPEEVEAVLREHPQVQGAAVVGVPDPVLGARPVGYVVLRNGEGSLEDVGPTLRRWCAERLSPFKVPDEIRVVDALPVGPTGKLARRRLADAGVGAAAP